MIRSEYLANSSLAFFSFVPSKRTTSGTSIIFKAFIKPLAINSQFTIPIRTNRAH